MQTAVPSIHQLSQQSEFRLTLQQIMRPEAHAFYRIDADLHVQRLDTASYCLRLEVRNLQCEAGWECPETLFFAVRSLMRKVFQFEGSAAFSERSEGRLETATDGLYTCWMRTSPTDDNAVPITESEWSAPQPVQNPQPELARDLLRAQYC